jgi:hypothetical protein
MDRAVGEDREDMPRPVDRVRDHAHRSLRLATRGQAIRGPNLVPRIGALSGRDTGTHLARSRGAAPCALRHPAWRDLPGLPRQLPPRDKLYAVYLDQELLLVSQGLRIEIFPSLIAATRDRARAEAVAYAFGVPVERWISEELDAQPVHEISLVRLLATPHYWIGKRVSVQGHLAPPDALYLTRDHARALDYSSSVSLRPRIMDQADSDAWRRCDDEWVTVQGFVDSDRGIIQLIRLESVEPRNRQQCWPPP